MATPCICIYTYTVYIKTFRVGSYTLSKEGLLCSEGAYTLCGSGLLGENGCYTLDVEWGIVVG